MTMLSSRSGLGGGLGERDGVDKEPANADGMPALSGKAGSCDTWRECTVASGEGKIDNVSASSGGTDRALPADTLTRDSEAICRSLIGNRVGGRRRLFTEERDGRESGRDRNLRVSMTPAKYLKYVRGIDSSMKLMETTNLADAARRVGHASRAVHLH